MVFYRLSLVRSSFCTEWESASYDVVDDNLHYYIFRETLHSAGENLPLACNTLKSSWERNTDSLR